MKKMYYTDDEHEKAYLTLIESASATDPGIKALLYVFTCTPALRQRTKLFIDQTGHPQLDDIARVYPYLSSGEQSMVRLGLNLFSGECGGGEGVPWVVEDFTPHNIIRNLDFANLSAGYQAILIYRG